VADSPTARALVALDVIQSRPGVTASELADRLGVTERAVRRYVEILRDADIPVVSVRGRYGGYRIGRSVRLPPVVFTGPEALGLVMAVLDSPTGAPQADSLVGSGVTKLVRALPESVGHPAALLWQHTAAAPADVPRPDPATTSALVEAVATGHRVRLGYRTGQSHEWTNEVDPWAVVVRYGLWYLLCRLDTGDIRTYRIDRVLSVEQLVTKSDVPEDLDAIAVLEQNLGQGWPLSTRVRFRAPADAVRPWIRSAMGTLESDGDECVLIGSTNNPEMYAGEWLAQIPLDFFVEGGDELRAAVLALAARLNASALATVPKPTIP
jgi:predicted DNA-binding transcriptional regulator YafY